MSEVVDPATLCPVTRLPMSKAEELMLATDVLAGYDGAPQDLLARGENRVLECVMRNREYIAEALAFFERKDAIRAAIAALPQGVSELGEERSDMLQRFLDWSQLDLYRLGAEDALAAFDREVGA